MKKCRCGQTENLEFFFDAYWCRDCCQKFIDSLVDNYKIILDYRTEIKEIEGIVGEIK